MVAAMDRRDGYKQALAEAAIPIQPDLIVESDFTQSGGYAAMHEILRLPDHPTAIFAGSDVMAAGALRAIHEVGLRVPDDMSLVSFDDLPLASILTPPLTTVHQPLHELGAAAADLLLNRLEQSDDHQPNHVRLTTHLVVRQSSGVPPARPR